MLGYKGCWGGGLRDGVSECHSIDWLLKFWLLHLHFYILIDLPLTVKSVSPNVIHVVAKTKAIKISSSRDILQYIAAGPNFLFLFYPFSAQLPYVSNNLPH